MEDVHRSKRRRVYSFEPNDFVHSAFSRRYMSYLLPALLQATNKGNKDKEMEKVVRFEVDMALVLSADGFRWSHALKHKLQVSMTQKRSLSESSDHCCQLISYPNGHSGILEGFSCLSPSLSIPRPIVVVEATRPRRGLGHFRSGEEELDCRVKILRRILPGGSEMGVCELLSEVESYVVCLQLQVDILRSLVDAR